MDDYSGIIDQIERRLGKRMAWIFLLFLWMAGIAFSINVIWMRLAAPLYRFVSTHNFASVIHHPSSVWIDILVVLSLIVVILIVAALAAAIVLWVLLALFANYIVKPIADAFKKRDKEKIRLGESLGCSPK